MIPRDAGQFTATPVKVTAAGSSVASTRLGPGVYLLYATAAGSWKQGTGTVAATANDHKINANSFFPVLVHVLSPSSDADAASDGFIAFIGTGDLYISKLL